MEDFAVQELVSEFVVKALDIALLPGRSRFDIVALDAPLFEPILDSISDELGSVVTPNESWRSMLVDQLFDDFNNILSPITLAWAQAMTFTSVRTTVFFAATLTTFLSLPL